MAEIDLDKVAALLRDEHDIKNACVEQTGGNVATLFAGPRHLYEGCARYAAMAGPGWFEGPGWTLPRADLIEFSVGRDDWGEHGVTAFLDEDDDDEATVARKIAEFIRDNPLPADKRLTDEQVVAIGGSL